MNMNLDGPVDFSHVHRKKVKIKTSSKGSTARKPGVI